MKHKKLINILILFFLSFANLHAFAIGFLDRSHCDVNEYVIEFDNSPHGNELSGDVCDIHHIFHTPFLYTSNQYIIYTNFGSQKPISTLKIYSFDSLKNFLKPPINSI